MTDAVMSAADLGLDDDMRLLDQPETIDAEKAAPGAHWLRGVDTTPMKAATADIEIPRTIPGFEALDQAYLQSAIARVFNDETVRKAYSRYGFTNAIREAVVIEYDYLRNDGRTDRR